MSDADLNDPTTGMSFGIDNLNLYIDPNEDNDPNFVNNPESNVDGYQLAWTQPKGPGGVATISTSANHQGVGFYTEAHVGTPFGDQGKWNTAGADVAGGGLGTILVAQKNGATGGVAEAIIPWADFDALEFAPGTTDASDFNRDGLVDGHDFLIWQKGLGPNPGADNTTGDANLDTVVDAADLALWGTAFGTNTQVETGLNATEGVTPGDVWFFNMSRINGLGDAGNFLPIWNWHAEQSFAFRPHGTITFVGAGVEGVPEPTTAILMTIIAAATAGVVRRRRMS